MQFQNMAQRYWSTKEISLIRLTGRKETEYFGDVQFISEISVKPELRHMKIIS